MLLTVRLLVSLVSGTNACFDINIVTKFVTTIFNVTVTTTMFGAADDFVLFIALICQDKIVHRC